MLDALGDGPAVDGACREGFEDEEVEGALDQIGWSAHTMIIYNVCRLSRGAEFEVGRVGGHQNKARRVLLEVDYHIFQAEFFDVGGERFF